MQRILFISSGGQRPGRQIEKCQIEKQKESQKQAVVNQNAKQCSYTVWKSMEFDFSNFRVWSMEKRKEYGKIFKKYIKILVFPYYCPYSVF